MNREKTSYDAIGTATTAATLTAAYTGNTKTLLSKYLENLHLDIKYTPKAGQTDRYLYLLIEVSNDDGTTFFPVANKSASTQQTKLYNEDADGNMGIPLLVPGDLTSTGGTAQTAFADYDIVGDFVKISVKESGSANFGTIYVRTSLSSK